jgi:hypothetical protein
MAIGALPWIVSGWWSMTAAAVRIAGMIKCHIAPRRRVMTVRT